MNTLSIIIPVFNEEKTLEKTLKTILQIKLPKNFSKEIITLDDSSSDNSLNILKKFAKEFKEISFYQNNKNLGKSLTVKKGILKSTGDYVIIQDADSEYDPFEISKLLKMALKNDYDVIYGNRFIKKNKTIYWHYFIGNRILSLFSNIFTYPRIKTFIPDMEVCYKLIKGGIIRKIAKTLISKSRFGFEPEITAKLSKFKINKNHLNFYIHPISYKPRTLKEGKKLNAVTDGWKAFKEIIRFNLFN